MQLRIYRLTGTFLKMEFVEMASLQVKLPRESENASGRMKSNKDEERQIWVPLEAHFLHPFSDLASNWFSSSEQAHTHKKARIPGAELRSFLLFKLDTSSNRKHQSYQSSQMSLLLSHKNLQIITGLCSLHWSLFCSDSSPAVSNVSMSLWIIERLRDCMNHHSAQLIYFPE